MSIYDDPVLAVRRQLEESAAQPTFVNMECDYISQQVRAGEWLQIPADDGIGMQAVRKVAGKPAQSVEEYCADLLKRKPHGLFELSAVDDADKAFLGDGTTCTLKERGDFYKKYGAAVFEATKQQYGCDDTLRAGKKPGPTHDAAGKKIAPPEGSSSNPWNARLFAGTEPERLAKMGSIIAMGIGPNSLAAKLAASAGCSITGVPLKR